MFIGNFFFSNNNLLFLKKYCYSKLSHQVPTFNSYIGLGELTVEVRLIY